MPNYTADWFSKNIPSWTTILADKEGFKNILEIGCFEGQATVWLLENLPNCRITAVDVFEETDKYKGYGGYEHDYGKLFLENITPYVDRVQACKGTSLEWLITFHKITPKVEFDLVYVDGSHQAVSVLQDIVLSWELLKEGGIMICDDYEWHIKEDKPRTAIDAFMEVYKGKFSVINKGYQIAFKKLAEASQVPHVAQ